MLRLRIPERNQVEIHSASLDELLESNHQARVVWHVVNELDLSIWLKDIKSFKGSVGRDATDPRLLVSLWLLAVLDGVGSARELARLCESHIAYRWLCGGVSVNYHLLSDFRSKYHANWRSLFTQLVSSLLEQGLVEMTRVAQDGMKVRANASKSSFRSKNRLERFRLEVLEQLEALEQQDEESSGDPSKRQRAAQKQAIESRESRIRRALENCKIVDKEKRKTEKKNPRRKSKKSRVSTTDPDARNMKFSDGGYNPGYNVQFSTDVPSGIIVGVDCVNAGNDGNQLVPMLEQLSEHYDRMPEEVLVDGGFATYDSVIFAEQAGTTVYAPLREEERQLAQGKSPYQKKPGDSVEIARWRERMGSATAKAIYKLRAQSAEWVNAMARNRGLRQMPVRGLEKCTTIATIYALAHNILQALNIQPAYDTI